MSQAGERGETPRRPRRGVFLAPFDELAEPRVVAELATLAEGRGWDGFFVWDHVQYPADVTGVADVWTCLTAAALATGRVRIGPMVTPLARRRPWVYARQAVTLDRLCGGRLTLGIGVGGDGNGEMAPLGEEPLIRVRAQMLEEGLELLGEIFSGRPVEHVGEHYTVSARPFLPRAAQEPRIPIWIGGRWPGRKALQRAARWDGVVPVGLEPADAAELAARFADRLAAPDPFELVALDAPGADPAPWADAGIHWLLTHLGPSALAGEGPDVMPSLAEVRAAIEAGPR